MSKITLRVAAIGSTLALAAGLVACGSGDAGDAGSAGDGVTVVATEMAFQPKEMRVRAGQAVTVRLENKGQVLHDWTVEGLTASGVEAKDSDEHDMDPTAMGGGMSSDGHMGDTPEVHMAADSGHMTELTFTPEKAGEYVYYCTVPGHRQAGMEGRLVVE